MAYFLWVENNSYTLFRYASGSNDQFIRRHLHSKTIAVLVMRNFTSHRFKKSNILQEQKNNKTGNRFNIIKKTAAMGVKFCLWIYTSIGLGKCISRHSAEHRNNIFIRHILLVVSLLVHNMWTVSMLVKQWYSEIQQKSNKNGNFSITVLFVNALFLR